MPSAAKRLLLQLLRYHGPLSDSQIAWWLGHFRVTRGAALYARRDLARREIVLQEEPKENERGQFCKQWALSPRIRSEKLEVRS